MSDKLTSHCIHLEWNQFVNVRPSPARSGIRIGFNCGLVTEREPPQGVAQQIVHNAQPAAKQKNKNRKLINVHEVLMEDNNHFMARLSDWQ